MERPPRIEVAIDVWRRRRGINDFVSVQVWLWSVSDDNGRFVLGVDGVEKKECTCFPVVAAATPVVKAPSTTCAPIATFNDHPVALAIQPTHHR